MLFEACPPLAMRLGNRAGITGMGKVNLPLGLVLEGVGWEGLESKSLFHLHASRRRPRRILLSGVALETNDAVSLETCKKAHFVD